MQAPNPVLRLALALCLALLCVLAGTAAAQSTGSADFTRYVAIGDSLGAGVISGGLVEDVQRHSYPALIYQQVHGSLNGFDLPTVSRPGINPILQLVNLAPVVIRPAAGFGAPTNLTLPRPYTNLSVPGADVNDVLNTVTDNGGLHDLILRGLGTQVQQALVQQPTFVTFWVNNDALSAAVSGVVVEDVTLTSLANFEAKFRAVTGLVAGAGARMALATIPNVTTIPFVTTVPPVLVDPVTSQPIRIGGNLVPLIGPDGPLVPGRDFVLLPATAELARGNGIPAALGGSGRPLSDFVVLSGAEVAAINARVAAFNQVIRAVANETGAALVDVNAIFAGIAAAGLEIGGIGFSADFASGGLFGLDGIHPTPLGYAVLANQWIAAINATYGAEIPPVDLYPYVFGPFASLSTGYPVAAGGFVFTPQANRQLQVLMGTPSRARLHRLKAHGG